MLFTIENNASLLPVHFEDFGSTERLEKHLETLIANNMSELFAEENQLMTIFVERPRQGEPDIVALNADGDLILFELKRGVPNESVTLQIMGYAQTWGLYQYDTLNEMFQKYNRKYGKYGNNQIELVDAHKDEFLLDEPLPRESFNRRQSLIVVGSSTSSELIRAIDFWKGNGLEIDFIPYRLYEIGGKEYFEFFGKPYDYHVNPGAVKGVIFDTNKTWDQDSLWHMLENGRISAYGSKRHLVKSIGKDDYVFYYHKGKGIVAAGRVKSGKYLTDDKNEEGYKDVEIIFPDKALLAQYARNEEAMFRLEAYEIREIAELSSGFRFRGTIKKWLGVETSQKLIQALREKV